MDLFFMGILKITSKGMNFESEVKIASNEVDFPVQFQKHYIRDWPFDMGGEGGPG